MTIPGKLTFAPLAGRRTNQRRPLSAAYASHPAWASGTRSVYMPPFPPIGARRTSTFERSNLTTAPPVNVPYLGHTYVITPYLVQHIKAQLAAGGGTFTILPEVLGENRMEELTFTI